jgi:hypothetical protein
MGFPKLFLSTKDALKQGHDCPVKGNLLERARLAKERLEALLHGGEITFDWNGHHKGRITAPSVPSSYRWEYRKNYGYEETITDDLRLFTIGLGLHKGDEKRVALLTDLLDYPGKRWAALNDVATLGTCRHCGRRYGTIGGLLFDGKRIKMATGCPWPGGHPPICVDIPVPSGVMVFANGFRKMRPPDMDGFYRANISGIPEWKAEMEHYARQGMAYGYCGNTCPSVYWIGRRRPWLAVGHYRLKSVAGVCTDLWAWTMADLGLLQKLGEPLDRCEQVKVCPGIYRVTQLYHMTDWDGHKGPELYAKIERLREGGTEEPAAGNGSQG